VQWAKKKRSKGVKRRENAARRWGNPGPKALPQHEGQGQDGRFYEMDEEIVWVGLDDFTWEDEVEGKAGEEGGERYGGSSASGMDRGSGGWTEIQANDQGIMIEKREENAMVNENDPWDGHVSEEDEGAEEETCEEDEEEDGDEDKEVEPEPMGDDQPPGGEDAPPPTGEEAEPIMKKEVVKKEPGGGTFVLDEAAVQAYLQYRKRLEDLVTSKAA
jgi:hypothetical protein